MKQKRLIFFTIMMVLAINGTVGAQQKAPYTTAEKAQLDSIKQHYLNMGIPDEWASRRAATIFDAQRRVETRGTYGTTPVTGSIWIDRDSITGAPNASHAHAFTPEEFVKDVFVKGGREIADQSIRNVTLISSTWNGSTTDTWNNKGYMGPFGGDAGTWTNIDRELLYFDHGDTSTWIPGWDGTPVRAFGMEKGMLLGTGPMLSAEGTNTAQGILGGGFTSWSGLNNGIAPPANQRDPDLSPLITQFLGTFTSLEFDFRSYTDSVSFQYIFASEEFPNYANSSYNDIFGFFVSGPNIGALNGSVRDTINIALLPNGNPVTINNSNWGNQTWYYATSTPIASAVAPQYHVPIYASSPITEIDGHTIILTAKARLQPGVWYHMKLAIANVSDDALGSGVFLEAGSLDLGKPESNVPDPYMKTDYDIEFGTNTFYSSCMNYLEVDVSQAGSANVLKVWSEGSGAAYVYDADLNKYFSDTVSYEFVNGVDSIINIHFKITDNVPNGAQVRIFSQMFNGLVGGQRDTTDIYTLYAKSVTALQKVVRPAPGYAGMVDVTSVNGSPYIQRSFNGGLTWEHARDLITGEWLPINKTQVAYLTETIDDEERFIIYREPNTCCEYDTVYIWRFYDGPGVLIREIILPELPDVVMSHLPGVYQVNSRESFTFTVTPVGAKAGHMPTVKTSSRMPELDPDRINVQKNADGSYTITVYNIQEQLELYITFTRDPESVLAVEANQVRSYGGKLYVRSDKPTTLYIYAVNGAQYSRQAISAGETAVALPAGFYVVVLEGKRYKLIIQ